MALTKVRLPVADIAAISNGTSNITIGSAGGDISITRAGVLHTTVDTAGLILNTGLYLAADEVQTDLVTISTAGGAEGALTAGLADLDLSTSSAHPLVLGANSIDGLTIGTDGKVTLGVQGTASTHLVNKSYVDTAATTNSVQISDVVANLVSTGSITIPNSTGNDLIVNWGITASIANTAETVVFDTAFPNAVLFAGSNRIANASREDAGHVNNVTLSGMDVVNSGGTSTQSYWWAVGY